MAKSIEIQMSKSPKQLISESDENGEHKQLHSLCVNNNLPIADCVRLELQCDGPTLGCPTRLTPIF